MTMRKLWQSFFAIYFFGNQLLGVLIVFLIAYSPASFLTLLEVKP